MDTKIQMYGRELPSGSPWMPCDDDNCMSKVIGGLSLSYVQYDNERDGRQVYKWNCVVCPMREAGSGIGRLSQN